MSTDSFRHIYRPGTGASPYSLLLLHGTGGSERDMLPLAEEIVPGATLISTRGQVTENGAPGFFGVSRRVFWMLRIGASVLRLLRISSRRSVPNTAFLRRTSSPWATRTERT